MTARKSRTRYPILMTAILGVVWMMILSSAPAGANPYPENMIHVHVRPYEPYECAPPWVLSCADVVQHTTETGDLDFVLFLQCSEYVTSVFVILEWDPSWSIFHVESCTDAEFTYEYYYGDAFIQLQFDFPTSPVFDLLEPLCKVSLEVSGDGCMRVGDGTYTELGIPPYTRIELPVCGRAQAGVECSYTCIQACHGVATCTPTLTPSSLHFELSQGGSATDLVQSVLEGHSYCEIEFDATRDWITLDVTETSEYHHDVLVTVDTTDLEPGTYEGHVRGTSEARDCTRITLEVTESTQGVPDIDPDGEAGALSWGKVKTLYR